MISYEKLGRLAKSMAHPTRLQILDVLAREEACVCHLAALLGQRQANISQHLMLLREARVVRDRREGLMVYYRLADPRMAAVTSLLRDMLCEQERCVECAPVPLGPVEGCACDRCVREVSVA